MSDEFQWWRNALAGTRGPIHDGDPQPGFYRQKRRDGTFEPVAYWLDSGTGEIRCHVNGKQPDDLRMMEIWIYASKNPISEADYWHRMDTGQWRDVDTAARETAKGPEIDPQQDPAASLAAEIKKAAAGLDAYKAIDSDEQSAKAQTLRSELTRLKGKAQSQYEALNRPLLDEQERIRKVWFPLRDEAEKGANTLRSAMEAWEDFKREQARKAQAEADRIAREHDEATRKAAEANQPPPPPPPKPTVNIPAAPATQIRGGSGRTASVTTKRVVTSIDLEKCWAKFGGMPEVYNLFMEMAQRAVDAGTATAEQLGAVIEEKAAIR